MSAGRNCAHVGVDVCNRRARTWPGTGSHTWPAGQCRGLARARCLCRSDRVRARWEGGAGHRSCTGNDRSRWSAAGGSDGRKRARRRRGRCNWGGTGRCAWCFSTCARRHHGRGDLRCSRRCRTWRGTADGAGPRGVGCGGRLCGGGSLGLARRAGRWSRARGGRRHTECGLIHRQTQDDAAPSELLGRGCEVALPRGIEPLFPA